MDLAGHELGEDLSLNLLTDWIRELIPLLSDCLLFAAFRFPLSQSSKKRKKEKNFFRMHDREGAVDAETMKALLKSAKRRRLGRQKGLNPFSFSYCLSLSGVYFE